MQLDASRRNVGSRAEGSRREDRTAIRLVKVGTHARHVADVIADVIRDGRRVARVVFWDSGFDLTHQVGTDIRRLRIDTAADTGKQGLRRGTHTESQHRGGDDGQLLRRVHRILRQNRIQQVIPERNIKQTQADNDQAHHRAAAEGNLQTLVQRLPRCVRRTRRGIRRRLHS